MFSMFLYVSLHSSRKGKVLERVDSKWQQHGITWRWTSTALPWGTTRQKGYGWLQIEQCRMLHLTSRYMQIPAGSAHEHVSVCKSDQKMWGIVRPWSRHIKTATQVARIGPPSYHQAVACFEDFCLQLRSIEDLLWGLWLLLVGIILIQAFLCADGYEYFFLRMNFNMHHVSSINEHFTNAEWRKLGPKTAGNCSLVKKTGYAATVTVSKTIAPKHMHSDSKGLYKRVKHKNGKYLDVLIQPYFTLHVQDFSG